MTHKNKPNNSKRIREGNNRLRKSKADKAEERKRERCSQVIKGICPDDLSILEKKTMIVSLNGFNHSQDYLYCPSCKSIYALTGERVNKGDIIDRVSKKLLGYDKDYISNLVVNFY
jgi:hypothetical protein